MRPRTPYLTVPDPLPCEGMKAGLCDTCRHQKLIHNTRGSTFSLCERAKTDERYPEVPAAAGGAVPGVGEAGLRAAAP